MLGNAFRPRLGNVLPGIHSPLQSGTQPRISLRWDAFLAASKVLGCDTDVDRADLFDLDNKTIRNLRDGGPVGDKTVAKILTVLRANEPALTSHGIAVDFDAYFGLTEVA